MQKTKLKFTIYLQTQKIQQQDKQYLEIHFEFKPWDGCEMVNIDYLILYSSLKYGLKYNKANTKFVHLDLLRTSFKIKIQ